MKKPTLKQLKRRPALWFLVIGGDYYGFVEPRITMPDGSMWGYGIICDGWGLHECGPFTSTWHENAIRDYEFVGWL